MWFPTRDELVNTSSFEFWRTIEAKALIGNSFIITKKVYDELSFSSCPIQVVYNTFNDEYRISIEWFTQYKEDEIIEELALIRSMLVLQKHTGNNFPIPIDIPVSLIFDFLCDLGYNIKEEQGKYYCEV